MASIFDGVPFITEIPGRRPPEDHARNLAVGVQLADVINRRRATERGQDREDRELTIRESYMQAQESQREAHAKLIQARVDALAHETADQALMNENLPKLYENPSAFDVPPPFKTFNALEQWEKSRALLEQRKLGIDRVKIAQGIDERLNKLGADGAALQARRMKEGLTPEVMTELGRLEAARPIVEGLSPNANTVLYAGDLRKRAAALQAAGDAAGAMSLIEEASKLEATTAKGVTSFTTNPDGSVTFTQGPAGSTGLLGRQSLEKQLGVRESMDKMIFLRENLRPEDLGVAGVMGEVLQDKAGPQVGLSSPDPVRTQNRTVLADLVASMVKQVSPENRFTEADQARAQRVIPSLGLMENHPHTMQMLDTMIEMFADRTVRTTLQDLGNDRNAARASLIRQGQGLNDYEIKLAHKRYGILTRDDVYEIYKRKNAGQAIVIPLQQPP